jgi:tight adherence protein C
MGSMALMMGLASLGVGLVLAVVGLATGEATPAAVEAQPATASRHKVAPQPVRQDAAVELSPVLGKMRGLTARLTSRSYKVKLQRKLDMAGNNKAWPAAKVMALKGLGLTAGTIIGVLLGAKGGITVLAYPAIGAAFGFIIPDILIKNVGQKRQIELRKGLPDALDMMTICVEAGLGFDAAIARVALNLEGPIASEWARVLQEMQFGKSRSEALRSLAERTDVPELRTFVSSLVQAAELGISVGNVLREQAREMRIKRRQRAQEQAQKLPVKILLPLIMCLLPCVFIVVLGPAILSIMQTMGHLGAH